MGQYVDSYMREHPYNRHLPSLPHWAKTPASLFEQFLSRIYFDYEKIMSYPSTSLFCLGKWACV